MLSVHSTRHHGPVTSTHHPCRQLIHQIHSAAVQYAAVCSHHENFKIIFITVTTRRYDRLLTVRLRQLHAPHQTLQPILLSSTSQIIFHGMRTLPSCYTSRRLFSEQNHNVSCCLLPKGVSWLSNSAHERICGAVHHVSAQSRTACSDS